MWSYRCLESGTVTKLSSCQRSDVAQKAISLLFILLALSSRTDEGLWSRDHELPRLGTGSFKCFGSPNSSGPLERWQGLRQASQGFAGPRTLRVCCADRAGDSVSLLRSLDLPESDLFSYLVLQKEVLRWASEVVPSF